VEWRDGGSGCPNRWRWDQILKNNSNQRITLTERVNYQDGAFFSRASDSISIDAGTNFTRETFVCLSSSAEHTFRTDWSGSDGAGGRVAAIGPNVRLLKKP
jgi:hypothetical protein